MPIRGQLFGRLSYTAFFLLIGFGGLLILHACRSSMVTYTEPAGNSYFPLAEGNIWVFAADPRTDPQAAGRLDTLLIDQVRYVKGERFYRLRWNIWDTPDHSRWLHRGADGNVYWADSPGAEKHPFLMFSADVGDTWCAGLNSCLDSLRLWEEFAVVETPYGRFDDVHVIGDVTRCTDIGWDISAAQGIGPVKWANITIAGLHQWLLVEARIQDDQFRTLAAGKPRLVSYGR
jgi:hypothetical protein